MQELFYHTFEQFTDQTLLLILCGPKGNGKTLRTERLEKCYVEGWIAMSGPSSAKAGMQVRLHQGLHHTLCTLNGCMLRRAIPTPSTAATASTTR